MASGIPVILSENTGHLDLIQEHCTLSLKDQARVSLDGVGTEGWGESSVDEIVEALEQIYQDRSAARERGQSANQMMQNWSWKKQIRLLKRAILPYL